MMTYHIDYDDPAPRAGEYLVSLGKRGVCSVWLLTSVRKVQHKTVREDQGYVLERQLVPELKPLTDHDPETNEVWVRGEPAHPLFWYPRS